MALGTPTDGGARYSAQNGTSILAAYPASIVAGDCLVLVIGQKPNTANGGTVTTPTDWTLQSENLAAGGYGTTLGADTGNTNLRFYTKDVVDGTETGTFTVTIGQNNISWSVIVRIPTSGGTLSYQIGEGSQTTTPSTALSVSLSSASISAQAGDKFITAFCIPTDVTTPGQFTVGQTTITGLTVTDGELEEPDSGTGSDIGGFVGYSHVDSGTETGTATFTATVAGTRTNVRGPVSTLLIREIAAITLNAEPDSYTITGSDATLLEDRNLTAESGSYAITGTNATLARELMVNAEPGSYSLTGFDAALTEDRNLNAESGSYSVTGSTVTFEIIGSGKELIAEAGDFSLTGFAAQLAFGDVFNAEPGSYAVTGNTANLSQGLTLSADAANYNLSGANTSLITERNLNLEPGVYAVTGADAGLMLEYMFNAETGAYVVTGDPAEFLKGIVLNAESAAYDITGFNAELNKVGSFTADAGAYDITGSDAILAKGLILNAEPATEYVEPGYVDPGYVIQTGYYVDGFPVTFSYPRYPLPNQVLAGVLYGPNGDDYVGTYVCPTPPGNSKQILYIFDD